jgi:CarD family transcriptional regulator
VTGVENYEIAGEKLRLFVISFERERMTLKVPITKVKESGLRKLSSRKVIDNALKTLKGRVRIKRTMWSRRAQEYDAKINSGDAVAIAEVVRDLHRGEDQPDQSYSERQMYQAALERLSRELGAVEKTEPEEAVEKIEAILAS